MGTSKEQSEWGKLGAAARNDVLTPEQRREIAIQAATLRWAIQRFLGTYPRNRSNVQRVDWHLRALSRLLGKAVERENWKEARNCIATMLGAERLKIWLETQAGRPGGPAMDVDGNDEAAKRLLDARKQRNRALGLEGEQETVVEAKDVSSKDGDKG